MKIIAISLRNYKCYQGTELIPIFVGSERLVGLIGENGVGKSAVLQGLYSFFTNQKWIRNKTGKKGVSDCGIALIIGWEEALLKDRFSNEEIEKIKIYSNSIKNNLEKAQFKNNSDVNIYFSCMLFQDGIINIFDGAQVLTTETEIAKKIRELILNHFKYIYIDAEINIDTSIEINSKTFELIKGSEIVRELENELKEIKVTNSKGEQVSISDSINDKVVDYLENEVIKKLQEVDKDYNYKNLKTGAQSKLSERRIGELAARSLFDNRELTKKIHNKDIGISDMSSGQRRKAFLDFVSIMIGNLDEKERKRIFLAIDEPEISVSASSRIQQFEKLKQLANSGVNVIFTTHWYGWIAQLTEGRSLLIKEGDDERKLYPSSIADFSNLNISELKPYEMRMMFDFLSSLGAWAESEIQQKFIICEGRTDFNFISKHFAEEKYKVIPTKQNQVIRLYTIFSDYYWEDNKRPSNIVFLIDTDPDKSIQLSDIKPGNLKRISRGSDGKIIITNQNNNLSEKCEIEDLLPATPFLSALKSAGTLLSPDHLSFINSLSIKYTDQTGIRAFGLDDVAKAKFREVYSGKYKLQVSESYSPSEEERKVFENLLVLF